MRLPLATTLLLSLLLAATLGRAAETPQLIPYSADYVLKKGGMTIAEGHFTLSHDSNGTFTYQTDSTTAGVISWFSSDRVIERTVWKLAGTEIVPDHYSYDHSGSGQRRVTVEFDRSDDRIVTTVNDSPWYMQLVDGVQDKLSVQLSLQLDIMQGKRDQFEYPVADGGTLKQYRFIYEGEERVTTPLGSFDTLRVKREGDKRGTTLWFAPELNYTPVRLEQKKKGAVLLIKSLNGLPIPKQQVSSR